MSKFLKSAKGELIDKISKNNRNIAFKAIEIYKDSKMKFRKDASSQTLVQNCFLGQLFPENPHDLDLEIKNQEDNKKLEKLNISKDQDHRLK